MTATAPPPGPRALPRRPVSCGTCWLAYGAAFSATVTLGFVLAGQPALADRPLLTGLLLDVAATAVLYAFSLATGNSSVYDPFWCLAPLALGFFWKMHAPGGFFFYEPRETLCLVLLWVWAVRFNVGLPWPGWTAGLHEEDWRYELMRGRIQNPAAYWAFSLSSLHLTPTLLVFAALCPVARVLLQGTHAPPLNWVDGVAASLTVAGIVVEAVADEQLRRFRTGEGKHGSQVLHRGLWRWSRHPNYCGESLFWTGLLGFGVAAGAVAAEPLLCGGAAALWAFFRFASAPLMDERLLASRPAYQHVLATTSPLLLWPPKAGLKCCSD